MPATPNLLIQHGHVLDPATGATRRADVRIEGGVIAAVGEGLPAPDGTPTYDATGRTISPGWMDMHVHFREPGQEHKETIATGARAAAFGGFTTVACMPNTEPPIHTADVVRFVLERAAATPVDVHPIACVSKHRAGEALADLGELADAGAVAFSDDGSPVYDAGLMRRALEYASTLGRPVINHMEELTLNPHGHMHEGAASARLGVAGIPAAAEEVMIARDMELAALTGGHVHVAHISTARAVELVRRAKADGLRVTAEACPHHVALTDAAVEATAFDTHTKMHPPLRAAADVEAVKAGLADGTIDALCTDHAPHAPFEKEVEFTAAPFGILGLETAWGLVGRELVAPGVLPMEAAVAKLTTAPRHLLGLPVPRIEAGAEAKLTVFDAATRWTFTAEHVHSKSANTPFLGEPMVGRAWAIYNKGQFVKNGA